MDGRDVGMVQDSRRSRLLLEAAQPVRIRRDRGRKDLDRHLATEPRIFGLVDLSHSSCPERREDLVGPEPRPGDQRHETMTDSTLSGTELGEISRRACYSYRNASIGS